ncbi:extensin family protein [Rhodobacteraceae bacterium 2CG4]|uniref:Extensin family protein n=1 Tax=Halovulum marinum TaxID=2662447 RepID=A0A6L5Z7Q5_9RHOB|nr:extensin family protein [Halovulum marinum]MSU92220.1 extensin family protein [Halovulum marinum]
MIVRTLALLSAVALTTCGRGGGEGIDLARAMGLPAEVGAICGNPLILGERIADIGGPGSCGIEDAVRVHAVGKVRLSPSARINCQTAQALYEWTTGAAQPVARQAGTSLTGLKIAASYSCRRRNNASSGKLSEHARGNAVDISAFRFANGETVTVLGDWAGGDWSPMLQTVHAEACGPFGVVLGPRANRYHRDHFHFDISNRSSRYCR